MTINQVLRMALKEEKRVNLHLHNILEPYENVIVKKIGTNYITFIVPLINDITDEGSIFEYTINKKIIVAIGYSIATI